MKKHASSRSTGKRRDRLVLSLVAGVMIGIALLAGAVGSAFAGVNANPATREFANHISHDNTTHRW